MKSQIQNFNFMFLNINTLNFLYRGASFCCCTLKIFARHYTCLNNIKNASQSRNYESLDIFFVLKIWAYFSYFSKVKLSYWTFIIVYFLLKFSFGVINQANFIKNLSTCINDIQMFLIFLLLLKHFSSLLEGWGINIQKFIKKLDNHIPTSGI